MRRSVEGADLFDGPFDSMELATAAVDQFESGRRTEFVPVHGRVAGYHIYPREKHVPIQGFPDDYEEGMPVTVTFLKRVGDISLMRDEDGNMKFYPRVRCNVEYGPELEPAAEAATGAEEPSASAETASPDEPAEETGAPEIL